jgi:integrase
VLRDDLVEAKVDRPTLLGEGGDNVQALRFHDLRATFVTWAMREGRGDGWISDRTGHLTPEMRQRCARRALAVRPRLQAFPRLGEGDPRAREAAG